MVKNYQYNRKKLYFPFTLKKHHFFNKLLYNSPLFNNLHYNIPMASHSALKLNGFSFAELFHADGLARLDTAFLTQLSQKNADLHAKLLDYRAGLLPSASIETSELLISCAQILEDFIASLFNIQEAVAVSQAKTTSFNPITTFKKYFVLRRAKKELAKAANFPSFEALNAWLDEELKKSPISAPDKELAIALLGTHYLENPDAQTENIDKLVAWCVRAMTTDQGQALITGWTSFHLPERIDHANLVPVITVDDCGRLAASPNEWRMRDGFKLTDERMSAREVQDEVNYCIYCHDHDGDFCSKGFPVKKGDPLQGLKKNPLDITLTGCPLEEKISEMNLLKRDGHTLGSLAMVMVDNPMCPATGHRICNDCMKSCIYQKQDPVNIPQIETRVLTDVLDLPWGVEIYDLLTRWNPLRQHQPIMKPYNGLKVMIAGMGPAGFTLAHHLLLEGCAVVGFDGLKIEPLPAELIHQPIYKFADLKESLDERLMAGFGGVAEYGITVRWDKNFLKLIYLSLMRKPHFQVFGGVRFGGTLTVEDAWDMGFHHFVVAVGAGLPKALPIKDSLAPGMRQANDFLMALQLGNAAKSSSLTNLQVRLPAVIIGGGLTGVDTATEVQAYYIRQVEKILNRYETLIDKYGEKAVVSPLDNASQAILAEYLRHAMAIREERERAKKLGVVPNFIPLLHAWGGVTIAYRRSMQESPAYINNHEELKKALEEGIFYAQGLEPKAVELDEYGHSQALLCVKRERKENEWITTKEEVRLPAKSILVATGTQPNTAYEFEHRGTFNRLNLQYQHYEDVEGELTVAEEIEHCKHPDFGPFTSYQKEAHRISLIGDTHPVFHGNVVKAIASGMRSYPKIMQLLHNQITQGDETEYKQFAEQMNYLFSAKVKEISRKTPSVIELTIQAPLAAKHFRAGQFYRLQNFETFAPNLTHTLLQMEPLALAAAECNEEEGSLTFLITEETTAAKLCATLKPGDPVSLMGPTGVRAKIPAKNETILVIGNKASFPFIRSYGAELKKENNKVIYVGQFANADEVYCQEKLEENTDTIVWLTKEGSIHTHRPNDIHLQNQDVVKTLCEEAERLSLASIDRIYLIGDTELMRRFQAARQDVLKPYLEKNPAVFASIYGNMQCMLKGVCAQCLQWQIDPITGERTKAVFTCSWQDQPLEIIDINHIDARQQQNRLQEHISNLWIDHIFSEHAISRV